jgi:hypothetical protein
MSKVPSIIVLSINRNEIHWHIVFFLSLNLAKEAHNRSERKVHFRDTFESFEVVLPIALESLDSILV